MSKEGESKHAWCNKTCIKKKVERIMELLNDNICLNNKAYNNTYIVNILGCVID